jgi:hypothetical protein
MSARRARWETGRAYRLGVFPDGSAEVPETITTGRSFMEGVIQQLTRPLDASDPQELTFERETPRLLEPDTEQNLRRLFDENRWTDFTPILLPTEERVDAMLQGTSHGPTRSSASSNPPTIASPGSSRLRRWP